MKHAGAWNIATGITILIVGIAVGVITIVNGAKLLKSKSDIMF